MNKTQLIATISQNAKVSKAVAATVLDATTAAIIAAAERNDHLSIVGFGSFSTRTRAARLGRNPYNGDQIQIAAKRAVRFTPSANFKKQLNLKPPAKKKR